MSKVQPQHYFQNEALYILITILEKLGSWEREESRKESQLDDTRDDRYVSGSLVSVRCNVSDNSVRKRRGNPTGNRGRSGHHRQNQHMLQPNHLRRTEQPGKSQSKQSNVT